MRSVLGGSVLGGDDLDGAVDELLAATMMATLILGGDDMDGSVDELPMVTMMATPIYLSLCGFTLISLSLSLSLSTFSICKMLFEGKTTTEMVLRVRGGIL